MQSKCPTCCKTHSSCTIQPPPSTACGTQLMHYTTSTQYSMWHTAHALYNLHPVQHVAHSSCTIQPPPSTACGIQLMHYTTSTQYSMWHTAHVLYNLHPVQHVAHSSCTIQPPPSTACGTQLMHYTTSTQYSNRGIDVAHREKHPECLCALEWERVWCESVCLLLSENCERYQQASRVYLFTQFSVFSFLPCFWRIPKLKPTELG